MAVWYFTFETSDAYRQLMGHRDDRDSSFRAPSHLVVFVHAQTGTVLGHERLYLDGEALTGQFISYGFTVPQ